MDRQNPLRGTALRAEPYYGEQGFQNLRSAVLSACATMVFQDPTSDAIAEITAIVLRNVATATA